MVWRPVVLATAVVVAGACSAQISDGSGASLGGGGGVDGGAATDATDGGAVAQCDRRTLYLNFEGQTLTKGPSDAKLNQASWLQRDPGTAPPFLSGNRDRAAAIQAVVDGVRAQLAQFPISVVTTRPATGDYVMVVLGGTRTTIGSAFGVAVNTLDCGDARPNDVAWITDGLTTQRTVNTVIGAVGFGLGLTATVDPKDCMCSWANACSPDNTVACTLGTAIARDPDASQKCPQAAATQDEVATIRAAFCR